ncbi:MAG TPA: response regulator, partial [Polyangiaceae bacterium]|nr:response regulator [Polyangiaceae bacterium]
VADGVAHDFTNVFAVVLSYANFIKESSPVGDPRRDDALEILSAAGEGTALIRRLLSVSERFTGEKPIELNESLLQLRGLLLRSLDEHRELQLIESRSALVVRIDPVRFDQLLLSLTLAASETAPDTHPLRILLESGVNPGFARITVQCVESELTELAGSSELPLLGRPLDPSVPEMAACVGIVESAGGSIVARASESLGKTFIVELPLWVESSSAAPPQLEAGHGLVLIAEGDTALRRAAARALSLEGYAVQVAAEYDEAVALLAKLGTRLDVLIGDLAMPGCADYELVAEARRLAPSAAVLVTAAFASGPENAGSRQDVTRLYKPLQPGELVAAVRAALAGRELQTSSGERPSRDGQGELVLVVEDDDSMRAALARILECAGYCVCQAARLAEARKQLETGPEPALVLCDLSLPDGSSVELMNWIFATRPALRGRTFVLSGGAVEDADIAFVRSGVVPVLRKPIEPGPLLQILGRARAGLGSSV